MCRDFIKKQIANPFLNLVQKLQFQLICPGPKKETGIFVILYLEAIARPGNDISSGLTIKRIQSSLPIPAAS